MKSRRVAIVGVAKSPIFRNTHINIYRLTVSTCRQAIFDAGLSPRHVDGIFQYSFGFGESPESRYVQQLLGIENLNCYADISASGPSGMAGVVQAINAVASGACEVAVAYRAITQEAGHTGRLRSTHLTAEEDWLSFALPYGWWPIIPTIAMMMRRRLHEFGGSLEEYGYIAINARRWARFNPFAVLRQPLTMDEYLSSRVLAEPLKLLDCDLPVTAVGAICIVSESVAHDLKHRPVWVDAVAFGTGSNPDWIFLDDYIYGASRLCSERLWKKSQFTIRDVDVALLYDGFTHITLSWLEALGFCGLGEAGAFIENGKAIGPGGRLPLNTNGGQLAEGRLHGIGLIIEAVLQLQGRCGLRQIKDAKVAVVTNGFGPQCGAMLLYTDD